jgi:predicted GH43/DUF377 family glycosyl hydrolase
MALWFVLLITAAPAAEQDLIEARPAANATAPGPRGNWSCSYHANTDFHGGASLSVPPQPGVTSATACCQLCATEPRCFVSAWNGPNYKTCYLKGAGAAPVADPGTTSCACVGTRPPAPQRVCSNASLPRQSAYRVGVVERSAVMGGGSLISKANGSSVFEYNFNTAAFPAGAGRTIGGLVVRVQDEKLHPEWANAGALAFVASSVSPRGWISAATVTAADVAFPGVAPPAAGEVWGVIDPRIAYRPTTKKFYLTWDNCTKNCVSRQTMLSTSSDPFNHSSWKYHGQVLSGADQQTMTAGVSLLFRDDAGSAAPHLAFVGNSNTADALLLAHSTDGLSWQLEANKSKMVFMAKRKDCWDAGGVAAGPQPEKLSNGDWLYICERFPSPWPPHLSISQLALLRHVRAHRMTPSGQPVDCQHGSDNTREINGAQTTSIPDRTRCHLGAVR